MSYVRIVLFSALALVSIAKISAKESSTMPGENSNDSLEGAMICVPKKGIATPRGDVEQLLLEQATRLLGFASMSQNMTSETASSSINEVLAMLRKLMDSKTIETLPNPSSAPTTKPTNTNLGKDLLDIVQGLLGDENTFDIPGLTITKSDIGISRSKRQAGFPFASLLDNLGNLNIPGLDLKTLQNIDLSKLDLSNLDLSAFGLTGDDIDPKVVMEILSTFTEGTTDPRASQPSNTQDDGEGNPDDDSTTMGKDSTESNDKREETKDIGIPSLPDLSSLLGNIDLDNLDLESLQALNIPGLGSLDLSKLDLSALMSGNIDLSTVLALLGNKDEEPGDGDEMETKQPDSDSDDDAVKNLLDIISVGSDILDEEKMIPALTKALEYILEVDDETINMIVQTITDTGGILSGLMPTGGSGKTEFVCHPVGEEEKPAIFGPPDGDKEEQKTTCDCDDKIEEMMTEVEEIVDKKVKSIFADIGRAMKLFSPSLAKVFLNALSNEKPTDENSETQTWSPWSEWSSCSTTCGSGTKQRVMNCKNPVVNSECQKIEEFQSCSGPPCEYDVAGGCPSSKYPTLKVENSCVVFHGTDVGKLTFNEMRSHCMKNKGDLVKMTDIDMWIKVMYWFKRIDQVSFRGFSEHPWIGASNIGHRLRWTHPGSNDANAYMIWERGQPINDLLDRCATMNPTNGHGVAMPCELENYAICQYGIEQP